MSFDVIGGEGIFRTDTAAGCGQLVSIVSGKIVIYFREFGLVLFLALFQISERGLQHFAPCLSFLGAGFGARATWDCDSQHAHDEGKSESL